MDSDPPIKALFACPALMLAGFALGSVTWILSAPRRAKASAADALDASPNAWDWGLMVVASLAGGLNLGVARNLPGQGHLP